MEEKISKVKQKYNAIQRELDDMRKDNQKLSEEKIYCKVFLIGMIVLCVFWE